MTHTSFRCRCDTAANVAVPGLCGPATLYRFDAANPLAPLGGVATTSAGFDLDLPARSATLAVFPIGLFADGLETASTSRWSAHVP
jgi:hypothetical protein